MRGVLFKTDPVTIPITTLVTVFTKDMDGIGPFTLYVSNEDVAASLNTNELGTTINGSPASRILWKAVAAGAAGNSKRIAIARDNANKVGLAVNVAGDDVTYTIGEAITAARLIQFVLTSSNPGGITAELTVPSTGGYGQAPGVMALTNLAGGVDSTVTGVIAVETSPNVGGPWVAVLGADTSVAGNATDLDALPATLAADTQFSRYFTAVQRFLRLNVTGGASATRIVATVVAGHGPQ